MGSSWFLRLLETSWLIVHEKENGLGIDWLLYKGWDWQRIGNEGVSNISNDKHKGVSRGCWFDGLDERGNQRNYN